MEEQKSTEQEELTLEEVKANHEAWMAELEARVQRLESLMANHRHLGNTVVMKVE